MLWRMLQHLTDAPAFGQEIGVGHLREILVAGHLVSRGLRLPGVPLPLRGGGTQAAAKRVITLRQSVKAMGSCQTVSMTGTATNPVSHFGKQLKKERLAHGWSLPELSQRTGIDAGH